jgi:hypothetical protein
MNRNNLTSQAAAAYAVFKDIVVDYPTYDETMTAMLNGTTLDNRTPKPGIDAQTVETMAELVRFLYAARDAENAAIAAATPSAEYFDPID